MALTQISSNGVKDDSIVNADIKSDAAIALSKLASTPAVLTGSTNNTITTVTGANAIQGEANLTFDGNRLTQTVDAAAEGFNQTASGAHYIDNVADANPTSADEPIYRRTAKWNGKDVAQIKYFAGSDTTNKDDGYITFNSSSADNLSERLRINSSGQLIQRYSAAPYANRAATFQSPSGQTETYVAIVNTETNGSCGVLFGDHVAQNAGNYDGYILYSHQTTDMKFLTNGGNERFKIGSGGDVTVTDGNLVIGTSGHGIDFSAGTGHSGTGGEILTDFEYGTWTPTLYFLSNNGGITYTEQQGDYTKVGNRVFFSFKITVNSLGSSAGNVLVWGLPYQVDQPTNGVEAPSSVSLFPISKLNISGDIFCGQITSQPDIELYNVTWGTGNNYSATQASQIADGFMLKGQGHYCTNS